LAAELHQHRAQVVPPVRVEVGGELDGLAHLLGGLVLALLAVADDAQAVVHLGEVGVDGEDGEELLLRPVQLLEVDEGEPQVPAGLDVVRVHLEGALEVVMGLPVGALVHVQLAEVHVGGRVLLVVADGLDEVRLGLVLVAGVHGDEALVHPEVRVLRGELQAQVAVDLGLSQVPLAELLGAQLVVDQGPVRRGRGGDTAGCQEEGKGECGAEGTHDRWECRRGPRLDQRPPHSGNRVFSAV
jgi:hypothetical protein